MLRGAEEWGWGWVQVLVLALCGEDWTQKPVVRQDYHCPPAPHPRRGPGLFYLTSRPHFSRSVNELDKSNFYLFGSLLRFGSLLFIFLSMQHVGSYLPNQDQIQAPCSGKAVLTTRPPRKWSQMISFRCKFIGNFQQIFLRSFWIIHGNCFALWFNIWSLAVFTLKMKIRIALREDVMGGIKFRTYLKQQTNLKLFIRV